MKKVLYAIAALVILAMGYYSLQTDSDAYEEEVWKKRNEKEDYLRTGSESPFVLSGTEPQELLYYPIDESFRISARIEKIETRQYVTISNSDGTSQRYLRYAWLHFELKGQDQKLVVLKPMFSPGLFLGFADGTSGETTYGGGRYLDIEQVKGDRMILDFNLAYNPYCAYDEGFTCPLPPAENVLTVKLEAGEKKYK